MRRTKAAVAKAINPRGAAVVRMTSSEYDAAATAKAMAKLAELPPTLTESRILTSAEAAAFWGVSLDYWRRLNAAGRVPKPIRIGNRKLGWRIGSLSAALQALEREAATA
jgi:predicted DNA-binding transcriptional regulator AlpA